MNRQDLEYANELFNKALEYYLGIEKDKNLILAKQYLKKSAKFGLTKAINLLADLYLRKEFYCESYEDAVKLYMQGWDLGDSRSLFHLAKCYAKGKGVKKDVVKAKELYIEAYRAGCLDACFDIALCYEKGIGVEQSLEQAICWYKRGAEMGDADCACNLGFCYYRGKGIFKDIDKAKEIFLKYSYYSDAVQRNLGVIFYKGTKTTKPDVESAIYWLNQSANNGDSVSMRYLGKIYREKGDRISALEWYQKGAEKDGKEGAYHYGFFLYKYSKEGKWKESFIWIKKAAENKHVPAEFLLGLFYKCGIGTDINHTKAFYWFNLASEHEYEQAYNHIGRYYCDGRIVTKNYETALVWFEKAITSKDDNVRGEALYDYGLMFLDGLGVKKDRNKAIDFLMESKSLGCLNAIHKLEEMNNPDRRVKKFGRASVLEHGDIIQYVEMKLDDNCTESHWVPNVLEKLIIYVDHVKHSDLVQLTEEGKHKWMLGNIDYAQWIIMVSDELKLYCDNYYVNDKKKRLYYPKYFANLFLTKKGHKFKPLDIRHNLSAINNPNNSDEIGGKHIEKLNHVINSAKSEIRERGL